MTGVEVRLLGGFEVWRQETPVTGFASQKVRGLLAYLLSYPERIFSRDHLVGLLWPEQDNETARHSLRQALYSLKTTLGGEDGAPPFRLMGDGLGSNPDFAFWLDVAAFEESIRRAGGQVDAGLEHLTEAVALYRGDFLAGFAPKDSFAFEEWLVYEQERLREQAITALRALVDGHLHRGSLRPGIEHAQRLVQMDPLAEAGHRRLMRLYALSGQRERALAQYETVRLRLEKELAVEPMEETRALYERLLSQPPAPQARSAPVPSGPPMLPLAGRGEVRAQLGRSWTAVLEGKGRMTLVEGDTGVGKTRLVGSFLDAATARVPARVLKARCRSLEPPVGYRPIADALESAAFDLPWSELYPAIPPAALVATLSRLAPGLLATLPPPIRREASSVPLRRGHLFAALADLLDRLAAVAPAGSRPEPLVVLLDDLHWADRPTLEFLAYLVPRLAGSRTWVVATLEASPLPASDPLERLRRSAEALAATDRIVVDRLPPPAVREIAAALLGETKAGELAGHVATPGGILPLLLEELVNLLWDEGVLVPGRVQPWEFRRRYNGKLESRPATLPEVIAHRVGRLPASTRRLLAMAAVIGQRFDSGLLRAAAEEHQPVVEAGLELMLEHFIVRHQSQEWSHRRPERDIVLWAGGARRGGFEFAHPSIFRAIYGQIHPARRRAMHRQVAEALQAAGREGRSVRPEDLAHHCVRGHLWATALPYLDLAARAACEAAAPAVAREYYGGMMEALGNLIGRAADAAERSRWRAERDRVEAMIDALGPGVPSSGRRPLTGAPTPSQCGAE